MKMGTALRKNGTPYVPKYIASLDPQKCIGCGRCYKVCGEAVFALVDRADLGMEDDDYEDEGAMVMTVKDGGNCIGCAACSRVCSKGCHSYSSAAV